MSEPILRIGNKVFYEELTKAGCSSFCVPISELDNLRLKDIPPHSTIELAGLPTSEAGYTLSISATNGGDEGDYDYLSIYGDIEFTSCTRVEAARVTNKIRRAFLPLVERKLMSDPLLSIRETDNGFNGGIGFSTYPDRSDTVIRETIEQVLPVFNMFGRPDLRLFICHASEDKKIARQFASFLQAQGAEVWLDQWEIKVGDSIVQKINEGLTSASYLECVPKSYSRDDKNTVKHQFLFMVRQAHHDYFFTV